MDTENKIEKFMDKTLLIHNNLKMVALTSAQLIINECDKWQPNGSGTNTPPADSILGKLSIHIEWSQHGYINALQSHAEIVYAFVKYNTENVSANIWPDIHEAILLAKSLETYQGWKEHILKRQRKSKGNHWASATGFSKATWNDVNEQFLDLYKK